MILHPLKIALSDKKARFIRWLTCAIVIFTAGALSFYAFYMVPRRATPILMYHSISANEHDTLSVTPRNFTRQIEYLRKSGFNVISLGALVEEIRSGRKYLPGTAVITFDDGFEDNFIYAFPVLSKYDMTATIFLITGYVGNLEGYLNWDQVRLMQKDGIDFGAHTRNNVYLPSVPDKETLWDEVYGSRTDIMDNTGVEPEYFCYPTGGFDDRSKNALKLAGYDGACTTNRGVDRDNRDVYALKRIKITDSDMNKPFSFRAKLSGFYNVFRRLRSGY